MRAAAEIRAHAPGDGRARALPARREPPRGRARRLGGGFGYLLKDRVLDVDDFLEPAERVSRGGSALDPEVVSSCSRRRPEDDPLADAHAARARGARARWRRARTNAGIAKQLWLTEKTVETHVRSILGKLDLPHDGRRPPARARRRHVPPAGAPAEVGRLGRLGGQGREALVLLTTGWAPLEMLAHPGDRDVRVLPEELQIDIAVELVEAGVAADLGSPGRAGVPRGANAGCVIARASRSSRVRIRRRRAAAGACGGRRAGSCRARRAWCRAARRERRSAHR